MKKFMISLTVLAISSLPLIGCSGTVPAGTSPSGKSEEKKSVANINTTGYPVVKEPITLTLMSYQGAAEGPFENLNLFKELEKKTNIKLKFNLIPEQGYEEKKNLAFASGDLPDFFFRGRITPVEEAMYGSQGILIPLEKLIDQYAPTIKKTLEEHPDLKAAMTASDGHIYSIPDVNMEARAPYGHSPLWIEKDLLEKTGKQVPKNTDELYELLKSLKALGRIPLSSLTLDNLRVPMMAAFGVIQTDWVQVKNDKVEFVPISDNYKAYLTYMNKLYKEGLIDPQVLTHTQQEFISKGNNEKLGIVNSLPANTLLKMPID